MVSTEVQKALDHASKYGELLEGMVVNKKYTDGERDTLLLAYWELVSDFHRGIHALIVNEFPASAFALIRPVVECLVRAHIALIGSEEDVESLRNDSYRVNFKEIGPQIDAAFKLGHVMENFLDERTRLMLHSYTHAGLQQLGRRFREGQLRPNYSDGEVIEVIHVTTSAFFMVTFLLTAHFGFGDDSKTVNRLIVAWGKH